MYPWNGIFFLCCCWSDRRKYYNPWIYVSVLKLNVYTIFLSRIPNKMGFSAILLRQKVVRLNVFCLFSVAFLRYLIFFGFCIPRVTENISKLTSYTNKLVCWGQVFVFYRFQFLLLHSFCFFLIVLSFKLCYFTIIKNQKILLSNTLNNCRELWNGRNWGSGKGFIQ